MTVALFPRTYVRPPVERSGSATGFRPEVEGLRAVAVLLVVADHLLGRPRGGFIGVDVFFVISGFLITGLLAKERRRTGKISIRAFYERRARRILPAALVVLLATWLAAKLFFFATRAHDTGVDVLWSLGFLANEHFARIGTDYFATNKQPSPVQHFWSLSVEEQFYLFWPILLIVMFALCRRLSSRRAQIVVTACSALMLAALTVLAIRLTQHNRATAYFIAPARAWELAIGAVLALSLAVVAPAGRIRMHWLVREVMMAAGLLLVAVSAVAITADRLFPAPAAAAPAAGVVLVILAGTGSELPWTAWPLINRGSRYVGRVSYSLYLWHWPVIIFLQARLNGSGTYFNLTALLVMAGLTVLSYHFIEEPFRHLNLAQLRALRHWRPQRASHRVHGFTARRAAAYTAFCLVVLSVVAWTIRPNPPVLDFGSDATGAALVGQSSPNGTTTVDPTVLSVPASYSAEIDAALQASRFPALDPSLDKLAGSKVAEWGPCGNVNDATTLAGCTFPAQGTATPKSVAVLGDSIGITWLPALRTLQARGYTVYGMTFGQCPAADLAVKQSVGTDPNFGARCNQHRDWTVAQVARLHPDLVVLASSVETIDRLGDGAKGDAAFAEWRTATASMITRVGKAGAGKTVVLSPPPQGPSLQQCATSAASDPASCVGKLSPSWVGVVGAEKAAAASAGAGYVDTNELFCSANGFCPSFVGTAPVHVDGLHLTQTFSDKIGTMLTDQILTLAP
ncbi:acyltransferase [Jatrophihabitans telluris]|uniref:Acyltransferase n=1 Tax=Jatrophihabitans telluris TaxID=2038343 RepID=A0ABY4QX03_9ACTN|nr:acyltransferase family protein [Jatrophihabitans telluris]UQX88211.1 acyltransferase [Jatrophihabitans telluris]